MTSNSIVNRRLSGFEVQGISSCRLRGCHTSVLANFEIDGRVPLTIAAGENHALAKVKSSPEGFECLPFLRCSSREWHCSWSRNQSGRWRHHYTGHERGYIDVPGIPVPHVLMHPSSPHLVSRFPTLCNSAWAVHWPGWFLVRVHAESAAAVRICQIFLMTRSREDASIWVAARLWYWQAKVRAWVDMCVGLRWWLPISEQHYFL